MDREDDERNSPVRPSLPYTERRRLAEQQYREQRLRDREAAFLEMLQGSPEFAAFVEAQDIYDEHSKEAIAADAAKEMAGLEWKFANPNIDMNQLARVVRDAIDRFSRDRPDQGQPQRDQSRQPERGINPEIPRQSDPRNQRLGKYDELERLSPRHISDDRADETARQQRDESDKRQTLTPAVRSDERKPTEQEHREAGREQTDRQRARSASTKELTDDLAKRRGALMKKFGYEQDNPERDGPEDGRSRER